VLLLRCRQRHLGVGATAGINTPLASMPRLTGLAQPISYPPPVEIAERLGLNSLRGTDWVPLFEDATNDVKLYNTRTGAVRDAPWIVLYTSSGQRLFINLLTRESRWFPPHRWMEGWVSGVAAIGQSGRSLDRSLPTLQVRPLLALAASSARC
jgi:hypothetical protein